MTGKATFLIGALLFLSAFIFRLWDITKQFEVWDETAVVRVGEIQLNNIKEGRFDKNSWSLNKEHPPFSKYFYGITRTISLKVSYFRDTLDQDYPLGRRYTFQRVVSAFVGSLSVLLVFLFAKKFFTIEIAALSALTLSFTPYFIAHSRVATQENLVAFLTLSSVFLFFEALKSQNLKHSGYLFSAVVLGLAIATKYNAFFFLILFAVLTLIVFRRKFLKSKELIFQNYIILLPIVSLLVFYVLWPWLWPDPIGRFIESAFVRIDPSRINEPANEYFLGVYPHNNPLYYFSVYFFATTPPVILVGLFSFIFKLFFARGKYDIWFLLYFLTPFLATFSPLKIDGIRYIFPVYPAVAICSSIGYFWLTRNLKNIIGLGFDRILAMVIPLVAVFTLFLTALIYHPYYWDYYNVIFDGPKSVSEHRMFDFGYWGEGLRNGMNYVYDVKSESPKKIYLKVLPLHVLPPYRNNTRHTNVIEEADYVIINPTGEWLNETNYLTYDFPANFRIVFEERVMDIPLVQVYKRLKPYTGRVYE